MIHKTKFEWTLYVMWFGLNYLQKNEEEKLVKRGGISIQCCLAWTVMKRRGGCCPERTSL